MINTSLLNQKLNDILNTPINPSTNEYLKKVVNYTDESKLASLNYLITQIPDDVDGLSAKKILNKISDFLSNSNSDLILVKLLRDDNITIGDLLDISKYNFQSEIKQDLPQKIKRIFHNESLKVGSVELRNYLKYDISTKEITENIFGVSNE